jgi:hypothetical protein
MHHVSSLLGLLRDEIVEIPDFKDQLKVCSELDAWIIGQ